MKNMNNGAGQKQEQNTTPTTGKDSKNTGKRSAKDGDTATGPNWNKKSKGAEGDSGQNAGVFK